MSEWINTGPNVTIGAGAADLPWEMPLNVAFSTDGNVVGTIRVTFISQSSARIIRDVGPYSGFTLQNVMVKRIEISGGGGAGGWILICDDEAYPNVQTIGPVLVTSYPNAPVKVALSPPGPGFRSSVPKNASFLANYRLATRPYALSHVFGAAGRFQYATLHHGPTSSNRLMLRHAWVAIESVTVAAIIMADICEFWAGTAPATGNPAITGFNKDGSSFGNPTPEAVALALPTTQAAPENVLATNEWNLGITPAGSTLNPPPPLTWVDLLAPYSGQVLDWETFPLSMNASNVANGFAVTFDVSVACTLKAYVILEWTENVIYT